MFHLFPTTHSVELKQLLSEFNRSLMLIADKQLLISNFLSKVNQIIPVQGIFLFLPDENTEKYKMQGLEDKNVSYFMGRGKLMKIPALSYQILFHSPFSPLPEYH